MPKILHLKGEFSSKRPISNGFGGAKLPSGKSVLLSHVKELLEQLVIIESYWNNVTDIEGALVSVYYRSIIAKSNRVRSLLVQQSGPPEQLIRGAKFGGDNSHQFHIFTYYITLENIAKSISMLRAVIRYFNDQNKDSITQDDLDYISQNGIPLSYHISKTVMINMVVDCYYVASLCVEENRVQIAGNSIISIYNIGIDTKELLSRFDICIMDNRIISKTTLNLYPDELAKLQSRAPYLIAMQLEDFSKINMDELINTDNHANNIEELSSPRNEPIIGVIDTHFDESVYFSEWVEYENRLSSDIELSPHDYYHGTAVSSIIVDGPRGNPLLDDGCGRFRVKHFGVATSQGFSSFGMLRMIRDIISENPEIKVWNLSLGSVREVSPNFISWEAAELDRIQNQFDVLFVIAGTNDSDCTHRKRIGAPADSINSIVVNSVDMCGNKASYTRVGPVLSFFYKPDISYFGGDGNSADGLIAVCKDSLGVSYVSGTSYAAPWISRKLAFLIHIVGLDRNTAKALIIDSAAGWSRSDDISHSKGYGVVPVSITDIISMQNDEIRFILNGHIQDYYTYSYQIPVPIVNNTHPYWARATLVYFPECHQNQGVDYTSTEVDLQFGRVQVSAVDPSLISIKPIDNNTQSDEVRQYIYEEEARSQYRKWDNVKHIVETQSPRARARKVYSGFWGIKVTAKERINGHNSYGMPFSIIVTLKAMDGINRIQTFIDACHAYSWVVNTVDIEQAIQVHEQSEVEIDFDD